MKAKTAAKGLNRNPKLAARVERALIRVSYGSRSRAAAGSWNCRPRTQGSMLI
jgi:hypothetical protein